MLSVAHSDNYNCEASVSLPLALTDLHVSTMGTSGLHPWTVRKAGVLEGFLKPPLYSSYLPSEYF